jgi:hypothetical protein
MTRCRNVGAACLIALLSFCTDIIAADSVVLPPDQIDVAKKQCSRPVPEGVEGGWMPSDADAAAVDMALRPIGNFTVTDHISSPYVIIDPYSYGRQYVGVIIHGRRLIYINALPGNELKPENRAKAFMACDGGSMFWGALYDPQTRKFSDVFANYGILTQRDWRSLRDGH